MFSLELLNEVGSNLSNPLLVDHVTVKVAQVTAELTCGEDAVFVLGDALEVNAVAADHWVVVTEVKKHWAFNARDLVATAYFVAVGLNTLRTVDAVSVHLFQLSCCSLLFEHLANVQVELLGAGLVEKVHVRLKDGSHLDTL